jgi:peptide chain release factor subunit 1
MEPLLFHFTSLQKKISTKSVKCSLVNFQARLASSPNKLEHQFALRSQQPKKVRKTSYLTYIELKLYRNVPTNGLVIFCGVIEMGDGKQEKKITLDLEPFKPINVFTYRCQTTFETEPLRALLEDDEKFGFIVVDGNGVLYATLQGSNKEVLQRMLVQLPKKHGRGGQSAVRFARIREEKRHNYVRKVCELATQHFITNDLPNIKGLILAGSA